MIEDIKDNNENVNAIKNDIEFMKNKILETARIPKDKFDDNQSNPWNIDNITNRSNVTFNYCQDAIKDYCMHDVEFICDLAKKTVKRQNIFRRIYDAILNFFNSKRQFKTYFLNSNHESK